MIKSGDYVDVHFTGRVMMTGNKIMQVEVDINGNGEPIDLWVPASSVTLAFEADRKADA